MRGQTVVLHKQAPCRKATGSQAKSTSRSCSGLWSSVALYSCAACVLWRLQCHDSVKLTFTGGPRAQLGPCRGCAESGLCWFAGRPRQEACAAPAELSVSFHSSTVTTPLTKTDFQISLCFREAFVILNSRTWQKQRPARSRPYFHAQIA